MDASTARPRLVIVGNGMVGHRLCQSLIALNQQRFAITVFSDENRPAYDRAHMGDVLTGRPASSLQLASPDWYRQHAIDLRLGDAIIGIDLQQRTVLTANGQRAGYDKLVIATGAVPEVPPLKVDDWNGVFVLRTLEDVERMHAAAAVAQRAVIIGGGAQGLETAAALARAGLDLTIIDSASHLMHQQLDAVSAALLKEHLEGKGIHVRLGTTPAALNRAGRGHQVGLQSSEAIPADFVVIATGVRPRDNLARWCLRTGENGGYAVNQFLQTSDPNVYAIGECASWQDRPVSAGPPGHAMAECLSRTLLGTPTTFRLPTPSMRFSICGLSVSVAGAILPDADPPILARGRGWVRSLQLKRGALVRAVAIGAWDEWSQAEEAIHRGLVITPLHLRHFRDGQRVFVDVVSGPNTGPFSGPRSAPFSGPHSAPHSGVHKLHPAAAAAGGVLSLLLIATLVLGRSALEWKAPQFLSATARWLREPFEQQLTGFGLLGLWVGAWGLSSRRLTPWFRNHLPSWRLLHIVVGVATVATLVVHTGLRLGANANWWLSAVFLLFAGTGGLATFLRSGRSLTKRWLSGARSLHKLLLWPALALLGLHILAVYYF